MTAETGFWAVSKSISAVLWGVGLFSLATGGLFPIIAIRLSTAGASDLQIGLIASVFFLGTLIGFLTMEPVIRKFRHARAFMLCAGLAGLTTLALIMTSSTLAWLLLRFAAGYGVGGLYLIVESWVNYRATNTNRARSMALYESVRMSGMASSPLILGLASGSYVFALAAVLFVLAAVPVAGTRRSQPELKQPARLSLRKLLGVAPLGVISCTVAGLVNSAFYGVGGIYGERVGLSAWEISLFLAATLIAPVIAQLPVGALADRFGRHIMLLVVTLVSGCTALLIVVAGPTSFWQLVALSFIVGGISHPIYALGIAYTNDKLDPRDFVRSNGGLLVAFGIGTSLGPSGASVAMTAVGVQGLYLFIAVVVFVVAALTLRELVARRRHREASPLPPHAT
ncbi:MAG: MFS transporter [Gammaproteobacteria bacterium]